MKRARADKTFMQWLFFMVIIEWLFQTIFKSTQVFPNRVQNFFPKKIVNK